MGLTIHYTFKHDAHDIPVRPALEQLRQTALDLPFAEVGELVELKGDECNYQKRKQGDPNRWLLIQAEGSVKLERHSSISVPATHLIAFSTWPGEGCEEANFGLCRYPAIILHQGKRIQTGLSGWRWRSFCKTQYASDPGCGGVENAVNHLIEVLRVDPKDVRSWVVLANLYIREKQDKPTGEKFVRKALELVPDDAWALNSLAALHIERGELETAVGLFEKSIAANPDFANSYSLPQFCNGGFICHNIICSLALHISSDLFHHRSKRKCGSRRVHHRTFETC